MYTAGVSVRGLTMHLVVTKVDSVLTEMQPYAKDW